MVNFVASSPSTTNLGAGRARFVLTAETKAMTFPYKHAHHKPHCQHDSIKKVSPAQRDEEEYIPSIKDGEILPPIRSSYRNWKLTESNR